MISDKFLSNIKTELEDLKKEGLYAGSDCWNTNVIQRFSYRFN